MPFFLGSALQFTIDTKYKRVNDTSMVKLENMALRMRVLSLLVRSVALVICISNSLDVYVNRHPFEKLEMWLHSLQIILSFHLIAFHSRHLMKASSTYEYFAIITSAAVIHQGLNKAFWEELEKTHFSLSCFAVGVHLVCLAKIIGELFTLESNLNVEKGVDVKKVQ
ncbi:unnamed protein product [Cuscuta epithymum]|uniref:Uncharacterized protein n=1 Tax=Cuscuta epithymum TaxID=186058 RepID=A0AAV0EU68_9ASTE|nr:unnamed protein product [Cuscuta epithymum]